MPTPLEDALTAANLPPIIRWTAKTSTRRKTVGITVETDAAVVITAPEGADPVKVAAVVKSRKQSIVAAIVKAAPAVPDRPVKRLVSGEGFPLLGRSYRLRITDGDHPVGIDRVVTPNGSYEFLFVARRQAGDAKAIIAWLTAQGEQWLAGHAPAWMERLKAGGLQLKVEDLGDRPAAFRAVSRTLAFHWALFQHDRSVIELELILHAARLHGGEIRTPTHAESTAQGLMADWYTRTRNMREQWRTAWTGAVAP
jgi:Protein of unknown function DUF45